MCFMPVLGLCYLSFMLLFFPIAKRGEIRASIMGMKVGSFCTSSMLFKKNLFDNWFTAGVGTCYPTYHPYEPSGKAMLSASF